MKNTFNLKEGKGGAKDTKIILALILQLDTAI